MTEYALKTDCENFDIGSSEKNDKEIFKNN